MSMSVKNDRVQGRFDIFVSIYMCSDLGLRGWGVRCRALFLGLTWGGCFVVLS